MFPESVWCVDFWHEVREDGSEQARADALDWQTWSSWVGSVMFHDDGVDHVIVFLILLEKQAKRWMQKSSLERSFVFQVPQNHWKLHTKSDTLQHFEIRFAHLCLLANLGMHEIFHGLGSHSDYRVLFDWAYCFPKVIPKRYPYWNPMVTKKLCPQKGFLLVFACAMMSTTNRLREARIGPKCAAYSAYLAITCYY